TVELYLLAGADFATDLSTSLLSDRNVLFSSRLQRSVILLAQMTSLSEILDLHDLTPMNPCAAAFEPDHSSTRPCHKPNAPFLCKQGSRVPVSSKLDPKSALWAVSPAAETQNAAHHPTSWSPDHATRQPPYYAIPDPTFGWTPSTGIFSGYHHEPCGFFYFHLPSWPPAAPFPIANPYYQHYQPFGPDVSHTHAKEPATTVAFEEIESARTENSAMQRGPLESPVSSSVTSRQSSRRGSANARHSTQAVNPHAAPAKISPARKTASEATRLAQQPIQQAPATAPLEPASSRRRQAGRVQYVVQRTNAGADPPLWSQSKRWTSGEKKELMAYQKMRQNIHYISASSSPFVPQTAAELAALKLTIAEERRRVIAIKVERLTAELSRKGTLGPRTYKKGHSLFLLNDSCFDVEDSMSEATWPTIVQLKEEGDRRADGARRQLPSPEKVYGGSWARRGDGGLGGLSFGIWPVDGPAELVEDGRNELDKRDIPDWIWGTIEEL
ncbi:hypothetical protein LLEC1_03529, partial [Akanthomyces lecanii]